MTKSVETQTDLTISQLDANNQVFIDMQKEFLWSHMCSAQTWRFHSPL